MTLLPRMTISPIVRPSAGTSTMDSSTTRIGSACTIGTPCRACRRARAASGNPDHSRCGSHTAYGPYVAVRAYTCTTSNPRSARRPMVVRLGDDRSLVLDRPLWRPTPLQDRQRTVVVRLERAGRVLVERRAGHDDVPHRGERRGDGPDRLQQRGVHDEDRTAGVVEDVADLLR